MVGSNPKFGTGHNLGKDYRIAGIYFEGINFRGWTITKDFADFIFVVPAFWRMRTSTYSCTSTPLASNP